jgi:hypothetical protein
MRFNIKPPDEIRLVGEARLDDLDRHLPPHMWLVRPVNGTICPLSDPLKQIIALNRRFT